MCIVSKSVSISARRGQVFYKALLEPLGVTTGQYMYLVSLCQNEGVSQEQLGEIVGINKSTTAKVISQLVAEDFVRREPDPEDKRGYKLYSTEKAREVYPKIMDILDEWNACLVDGMTLEERQTLAHLMDRVEQNARKHCREGKVKNEYASR